MLELPQLFSCLCNTDTLYFLNFWLCLAASIWPHCCCSGLWNNTLWFVSWSPVFRLPITAYPAASNAEGVTATRWLWTFVPQTGENPSLIKVKGETNTYFSPQLYQIKQFMELFGHLRNSWFNDSTDAKRTKPNTSGTKAWKLFQQNCWFAFGGVWLIIVLLCYYFSSHPPPLFNLCTYPSQKIDWNGNISFHLFVDRNWNVNLSISVYRFSLGTSQCDALMNTVKFN